MTGKKGTFPRLLLAEDDEDNRGLIKRILECRGYEVDDIEDGEIARTRLQTRHYDILVTDLSMPHLDGYSLLKWLRDDESRRAARRIPALVLTAHALVAFEKKSLSCGADAFMTKPIRPTELCTAVNRLLEIQPKPSALEVRVPADIEDLIPTFLENRRRDVESLREAVPADNWSFMQRVGHGMKGTGGAYGFDEISKIGAAIEASSKMENRQALIEAIDQLVSYLDRLRLLDESGNALS